MLRFDVLVAEAVERRRPTAPGISFDLDAEPCFVRAAERRVERAIANLIDNAVKWSPPGGTVEITRRRRRALGPRPRPGLRAGGPAAGLRPLLSLGDRPRAARFRPRARDRPPGGRDPGRHGGRRERGRRGRGDHPAPARSRAPKSPPSRPESYPIRTAVWECSHPGLDQSCRELSITGRCADGASRRDGGRRSRRPAEPAVGPTRPWTWRSSSAARSGSRSVRRRRCSRSPPMRSAPTAAPRTVARERPRRVRARRPRGAQSTGRPPRRVHPGERDAAPRADREGARRRARPDRRASGAGCPRRHLVRLRRAARRALGRRRPRPAPLAPALRDRPAARLEGGRAPVVRSRPSCSTASSHGSARPACAARWPSSSAACTRERASPTAPGCCPTRNCAPSTCPSAA